MGSIASYLFAVAIAVAWILDHRYLSGKLSHSKDVHDNAKRSSDYALRAKESLIHKLEQQVMKLSEESGRYKPVDELLKSKLLENELMKKELLTLKTPVPETKVIKAASAADVRKLVEEQNFKEAMEKAKDA